MITIFFNWFIDMTRVQDIVLLYIREEVLWLVQDDQSKRNYFMDIIPKVIIFRDSGGVKL